jgi:hypothetical protein
MAADRKTACQQLVENDIWRQVVALAFWFAFGSFELSFSRCLFSFSLIRIPTLRHEIGYSPKQCSTSSCNMRAQAQLMHPLKNNLLM